MATGIEHHKEVIQTKQHNFRAFAQDPNYIEENEYLIRLAFNRLPKNQPTLYHADLGAGTGLVPQVLGELFLAENISGSTFCIEPDSYAIALAERYTSPNTYYQVIYLPGYAQDAPVLLAGKIPPQGVDYVTGHDFIHEVEGDDQKKAVLKAAYDILKPAGLLTLNSAFTSVAMTKDGLNYGKWMVEAYKVAGEKLQKPNIDLLSPETYLRMLRDQGFKIDYSEVVDVAMVKTALEAISTYPRFVKGFFPHISQEDIPAYSQHLIQALGNLGYKKLSRQWFRVLAQKPA